MTKIIPSSDALRNENGCLPIWGTYRTTSISQGTTSPLPASVY